MPLKKRIGSLVRALLGLLLCGVAVAAAAAASDVELEKQWHGIVADQLIDGEIIWLKGQADPFYSVFAEGDGKPAVILMHGMRRHANWLDVIEPLRLRLLDQGWTTLSLQMPVLGHNTGMRDHAVLLDESPARIDAAIDYLQQRGHKKIFLIGHGLGAIMGAAYLVERGEETITGLVAIGLYSLNYSDARMWSPHLLRRLELPILDIFGVSDQFGVARSTDIRKAAAIEAENVGYTQQMIEGNYVGHDFRGHSETLLVRVSTWLNNYAD